MNTPYTKALADLCNNQGGHICGALVRLPDNRQATVDEHGTVYTWEASDDGKLYLSERKAFEGVAE